MTISRANALAVLRRGGVLFVDYGFRTTVFIAVNGEGGTMPLQFRTFEKMKASGEIVEMDRYPNQPLSLNRYKTALGGA